MGPFFGLGFSVFSRYFKFCRSPKYILCKQNNIRFHHAFLLSKETHVCVWTAQIKFWQISNCSDCPDYVTLPISWFSVCFCLQFILFLFTSHSLFLLLSISNISTNYINNNYILLSGVVTITMFHFYLHIDQIPIPNQGCRETYVHILFPINIELCCFFAFSSQQHKHAVCVCVFLCMRVNGEISGTCYTCRADDMSVCENIFMQSEKKANTEVTVVIVTNIIILFIK